MRRFLAYVLFFSWSVVSTSSINENEQTATLSKDEQGDSSVQVTRIFEDLDLLLKGKGDCLSDKKRLFLESIVADSQKIFKPEDERPWINVFIHGTHGSLIGLVSIFKVLTDRTKDTYYNKLQQKRRDYQYFYSEQLMDGRGLRSMDVNEPLPKELDSVALPLVKAYDAIRKHVTKNSAQAFFYTFGWNGLLSQLERRREAIRFYNELCTLRDKVRQQGMDPRIRLIGHSHGGNVCLNLASIWGVLNEVTPFDVTEAASREAMEKLLNKPIKKNTLEEDKVLYTKPTDKTLHVDELVMYGTPIQDETECFCFYPFFNHVINIYSHNDVIQEVDFMSTQSRRSRKRIDSARYTGLRPDGARVTQVQIMINRDMAVHQKPFEPRANSYKNPRRYFADFYSKLRFGAFMRGGRIMPDHPCDPSHADFWLVDWDRAEHFIDPLPLVIFTPVFLEALENTPFLNDSDLNIYKSGDALVCSLYKHGFFLEKGSYQIPLSLVQRLRLELLNARHLIRNKYTLKFDLYKMLTEF